MNQILRVFFQSLGLTLLIGAWTLDPAAAEFKHLLVLLHSRPFWEMVLMFAVMLFGANMVFSQMPRGVASTGAKFPGGRSKDGEKPQRTAS